MSAANEHHRWESGTPGKFVAHADVTAAASSLRRTALRKVRSRLFYPSKALLFRIATSRKKSFNASSSADFLKSEILEGSNSSPTWSPVVKIGFCHRFLGTYGKRSSCTRFIRIA